MVKRKKRVLSPEQKDQIAQRREVRSILSNMGFHRIAGIDGKNFQYDGRTSEMDDVFFLENVMVIMEYTIVKEYKSHLAKKNLFYQKVLSDPEAFIEFLNQQVAFNAFKEYYEKNVLPKFPSRSQIQVKIVYCSKEDVSSEYRRSIPGVHFFDYYIVHYFKFLSSALKKSAKYDFLDFLDVSEDQFGDRISENQTSSSQVQAYVLPEVKTLFNEGYKVVTFYMDPDSILKRAYVLRHEGWREKSSATYYQRMADPKRIAAIRKYVATEKRVFVNNIIVTLSEDNVVFYDSKNNMIPISENGKFGLEANTRPGVFKMSLNEKRNTVGIIDGQHRVFSYHEGDDIYEEEISKLRHQQNLLVTGILFPKKEKTEARRKFEANLFKDINVKQVKISSYLQQELDLIVSPFSMVSIAKLVLFSLNEEGPLAKKMELYSFDKGKVKTASIVSFGLRPLIKLGDSKDTLFSIWMHPQKEELLNVKCENYSLRDEYVSFCAESIRNLLLGIKNCLPNDRWHPYDHKTNQGILTTTFINGCLNLLRLIIENENTVYQMDYYISIFKSLHEFDFKKYKSSHYREMGNDMYRDVFKK